MRITKLGNAAADHRIQGNRLINMARQMKANARLRNNPRRKASNTSNNVATMEAYKLHAENLASFQTVGGQMAPNGEAHEDEETQAQPSSPAALNHHETII